MLIFNDYISDTRKRELFIELDNEETIDDEIGVDQSYTQVYCLSFCRSLQNHFLVYLGNGTS